MPPERFKTVSLLEKLHVKAVVAGAPEQTFAFSETIPLPLELKWIVLSSEQAGMEPVVLKSTRMFPLASPIPPLSYFQSALVICSVLVVEELESFLQDKIKKEAVRMNEVNFISKF